MEAPYQTQLPPHALLAASRGMVGLTPHVTFGKDFANPHVDIYSRCPSFPQVLGEFPSSAISPCACSDRFKGWSKRARC